MKLFFLIRNKYHGIKIKNTIFFISLSGCSILSMAQKIPDSHSQHTHAINVSIMFGDVASEKGRQLIEGLTEEYKNSARSQEQTIAYFNLSHLNKAQTNYPNERDRVIASIGASIREGYIIILDTIQSNSSEVMKDITSKVGGVTLSKSLVIIGKKKGSLSYYVIHSDPRGEYVIPPLLTRKITEERIAEGERRKKRSNDEYSIGKTVYLTFSHNNLSCMLDKKLEPGRGIYEARRVFREKYDACQGSASYTAQVRIDYIPSRNYTGKTNFPTGKIVRIAAGLEGLSGTGWHLTNELKKIETEYTSNTKRTTWHGPFAAYYETMINPNDSDVILIDHKPLNKNTETEVNEESSLSVQQGFSTNLQIGGSGPLVGLKLSEIQTTTNTVNLKYNTQAYKIINQTSGNIFSIKWEHSPQQLVNSKNYVEKGGWPINTRNNQFGGMSYANFIPGFVAIYKAPFSKTGSSTFTVNSNVMAQALATYVTPYLYADESDGSIYPTYATRQKIALIDEITINWDSPYFASEVPVVIKADKHAGLYCLTMRGEDQGVWGEACNGSSTQLWGLSQNEEYISLANPRLCLTAHNSVSLDETPIYHLITKRCEQSAFQKWAWQGEDKSLLVNAATLDDSVRKYVSIGAISDNGNFALPRVWGGPRARNQNQILEPARFKSWKPYIQRPE